MVAQRAAEPDATLSFATSAVSSYNEKLALLRRHYRSQTFAVNASDLLNPAPVFDSLASATAAAESAIATALEIARDSDSGIGGTPVNLAVLALGRLGTNEFDLGSDADLLFLRSSEDDPIAAKRLAEQVVNILAAYTQEGTVFAVDARLRPLSGSPATRRPLLLPRASGPGVPRAERRPSVRGGHRPYVARVSGARLPT